MSISLWLEAKKNGPAKARTVDRAWGLECQDTDDGNHTQNGG